VTIALADCRTAEAAGIWLEAGLAGFPAARRFALEQWGGSDSPFMLLRSLEVGGLEFVTVPPAVFFPDYRPEIDDASAARLLVRDPDDAVVLVILTVGDDPRESTANLLGPIVINRHTGCAAQVVLADRRHDVRTPLVKA